MKNSFLKTLVFLFILNSELAHGQNLAPVRPNLNFEGDTLSFELSGRKSWDYDLKRIKDKTQPKVQLFVKNLDVVEKLQSVKNPFVKSVNVTKNAIDNKYLVEFLLTSNQVETFDYLTDQPSKLIIDFYLSDVRLADSDEAASSLDSPLPAPKAEKKEKTVATTSDTKNKTRKPAEADALVVANSNSEIDKSLLSKMGLFDGADVPFSRFNIKESEYKEEAVIKSRSNYYLKFPNLESEFAFWHKMKANPVSYEIEKKDTEENKQVRLLQTLFTKKRYLVFLQTAEWFKQKFPKSNYADMVAFMQGDAYFELWKEEKNDTFYQQGQNAYREALEKYPNSILAERISLSSGMYAIDKLDYMSAIRKLQAHTANSKYDNKPSKQYAKVGLALSLSKINKLDDALALLKEIESQTKDPMVLAEVAVRRGDFYFSAKKMKEAVDAYSLAALKFPEVSKYFPSAYFNRMEALFWDQRFKGSHQSALEFAQLYPSHEYAPYALTRVGELLDIMGADQSKSVGAYLETHFRYGDSPKTIVARLHLLSTKMKSMKPEELEPTLIKMDDLAKKSDLNNVDQFKVAMISDGFTRRQEFLRAVDILSKFYQQNPTRADSKQLTQRIVKNISDELHKLSGDSKYSDLMKLYKQYSDTWLKTSNRIDTDYFVGLAYENAGAYSAAITKFKKVQGLIEKLKGSPTEKEVLLNQYLPTIDSLNLKLAQNNFEDGSLQEAYSYLEKIKEPLLLSEPDQVSRVELASALNQQKGDPETSIRYLSDLSSLWKGSPQLALPVDFKLAEMQMQRNSPEEAINAFEKCKTTILDSKNASEEQVNKLGTAYGDLLVSQGKSAEAIDLFKQIIATYSGKYNLEQEKYSLGDLYYSQGENKKAETAWQEIKDKNSIWSKLADEKTKQAAWDVEYKKYIKRIPAMSKAEGIK